MDIEAQTEFQKQPSEPYPFDPSAILDLLSPEKGIGVHVLSGLENVTYAL